MRAAETVRCEMVKERNTTLKQLKKIYMDNVRKVLQNEIIGQVFSVEMQTVYIFRITAVMKVQIYTIASFTASLRPSKLTNVKTVYLYRIMTVMKVQIYIIASFTASLIPSKLTDVKTVYLYRIMAVMKVQIYIIASCTASLIPSKLMLLSISVISSMCLMLHW